MKVGDKVIKVNRMYSHEALPIDGTRGIIEQIAESDNGTHLRYKVKWENKVTLYGEETSIYEGWCHENSIKSVVPEIKFKERREELRYNGHIRYEVEGLKKEEVEELYKTLAEISAAFCLKHGISAENVYIFKEF